MIRTGRYKKERQTTSTLARRHQSRMNVIVAITRSRTRLDGTRWQGDTHAERMFFVCRWMCSTFCLWASVSLGSLLSYSHRDCRRVTQIIRGNHDWMFLPRWCAVLTMLIRIAPPHDSMVLTVTYKDSYPCSVYLWSSKHVYAGLKTRTDCRCLLDRSNAHCRQTSHGHRFIWAGLRRSKKACYLLLTDQQSTVCWQLGLNWQGIRRKVPQSPKKSRIASCLLVLADTSQWPLGMTRRVVDGLAVKLALWGPETVLKLYGGRCDDIRFCVIFTSFRSL